MFCWQLVRFKCLAGSTFGVIIDFWPQGDRKRPPKQMYWVFVAKQFLYLDNKQTRSNTSVPTDRVSFHLLNVSVIITGVDIAAVCIFHIMLGKHLRCEEKKKSATQPERTKAAKSCSLVSILAPLPLFQGAVWFRRYRHKLHKKNAALTCFSGSNVSLTGDYCWLMNTGKLQVQFTQLSHPVGLSEECDVCINPSVLILIQHLCRRDEV